MTVFAVPSGKKLGFVSLYNSRAVFYHRFAYLSDGETVVYGCNSTTGFSMVQPLTGLMTPWPDKGDKFTSYHFAYSPKTNLLAVGYKDIRLWKLAAKKDKDD